MTIFNINLDNIIFHFAFFSFIFLTPEKQNPKQLLFHSSYAFFRFFSFDKFHLPVFQLEYSLKEEHLPLWCFYHLILRAKLWYCQ